MKIKRITIKNFKGISEKDVLFADRKVTALFGPNGIGKSSFIEALRWGLTGVTPQNPIRDGAASSTVTIVTEDGTDFSRTIYRDKPSKVTVNGRTTPAKNLNAYIKETFGFDTDILKIATSADVLASMKSDELGDFLLQYIPEKLTVTKILGCLSDPTEEIQEAVLLAFPDEGFGIEDVADIHESFMSIRKASKKDLDFIKGKVVRLPEVEPARKCEEIQGEMEELFKREGAAKGAIEAVKMYESVKKERETRLANLADLQKRFDSLTAIRPNPAIRAELEKKLFGEQKRSLDAKEMISIMNNTIRTFKLTLEKLSSNHCPISDSLICTTDKTAVKDEIIAIVKSNEEGIAIQNGIVDECAKKITELSSSLKEYDSNAVSYKEKILIGEQIEKMKKTIPELPSSPPSLLVKEDYEKEKAILREEMKYAKDWEEKKKLEKDLLEAENRVKVYDYLCKTFAPKGEVMTKILSSYLSIFEEEVNKRSEMLRAGLTVKFVPENGVQYLVKIKGEKEFHLYDELSKGEKTIAIFLLLDLVSALCGTKIMILDDLNNLDKASLDELLNFITDSEFLSAYDNIVISSVNSEDVISVCRKYEAVIQI